MMRIKVSFPNLAGRDLTKATDRKKFSALLASKGVLDWSYHFGAFDGIPVFYATVIDTFDLTMLAEFGEVEVIENAN